MFTQEEFLKNTSFIILSPEPNPVHLRDTVRSIRNNFHECSKSIVAVPKSIKKNNFDELKEICPVFRAGETITSLMNLGMKKSAGSGWRIFVMEGARIPRGLDSRYRRWMNSKSDVIFPIVVNHDLTGRPLSILADFEDCTLNGLMIHSDFFSEIGDFSDNPIQISKRFWALGASEGGATFKAILGVKIL